MKSNGWTHLRTFGRKFLDGFGRFMRSLELTEVRIPRSYGETRLTWHEMNTRWL